MRHLILGCAMLCGVTSQAVAGDYIEPSAEDYASCNPFDMNPDYSAVEAACARIRDKLLAEQQTRKLSVDELQQLGAVERQLAHAKSMKPK